MHNKILEAIKQLDYKDIAIRALWTFLQAFLGVFLFTSNLIIDSLFNGDWTGLYVLLITTSIAGASAGLSALKTFIIGIIKELKTVK